MYGLQIKCSKLGDLKNGREQHFKNSSVAQTVRDWIGAVGAKTAYIEPGSPWENGYIESFNARMRDELLDGEMFYTLAEARIIIEQWRRHYITTRPHSALNYRPPAPESIVSMDPKPTMH